MGTLNQPRIAAALAAAMTLAHGSAQAQTPMVAAFSTANVVEALTAVGVTDAQPISQPAQNGQTVEAVRFSTNGIRHVAILEVCNSSGAQGCLGLNLLTIWGAAGAIVDRNRVNDFNAQYAFGKGIIAGDALVFQRYAISDGGISKANVRSNITNFAALGQSFANYVGGSAGAGTISATAGEAALLRAGLSPESAAVIKALGAEAGNRWNAPRATSTIEPGAHAAPR